MIGCKSPSAVTARGAAVVMAALLCWVPSSQAGEQLLAGRAKARECRACHGIDGISRMPNVPHIAGQSEMYLAKQLRAFRSGERKDPQMRLMAGPLSDQDIADLAAWYAAIEISVELPDMEQSGGD